MKKASAKADACRSISLMIGKQNIIMKRKINILIADTKRVLFALVLTLCVGTAYSQTYTFVYTGSVQTVTLPNAGFYDIECWGADGGEVTAEPGGAGKGGYARGTFNALTAGTQIYVFVGGKGAVASGTNLPGGNGGWNGGGGGGTCGRSGGGGGGATDVRAGGTAATDRVIVAGGGGGAAYYSDMAAGGHGGGQVGVNGDFMTSANVLTTGAGGVGANGASPGLSTYTNTANGTITGGGGGGYSPGGFGQPGTGGGPGGIGGNTASGATGGSGGGGGGYAGGAGGTQTVNAAVGGGGGSSYVGGVLNGTTIVYAQPNFVYSPNLNGDGHVIIKYRCDVNAQASKNPICIGEQITLSTDAGSNIQWSNGPTTASIVVSPTTSTSYTVTGTTSSPSGCNNTIVVNVTVNPLPVITAAPLPTVVCQNQAGTLTASGAVSYTWNPGNSTGNTLVSNPGITTIFTLEGLSAHNCYNTTTVAMNVNTNQLVMSPDTTVCEGSPAFLRSNGAVYYNWTIGAPFQNVTVYPSTSTMYSVSAIDEHNCPLGGSVTVIVIPRPVVSVAAVNSVVCRGEPIELFADGAATYLWSNGAGGSSLTTVPKVDLPVEFHVTGTGNNGCTSTASITVIVNACTSVTEEQLAAFTLMPNPASNDVTIESAGDAKWRIADVSGRLLLEGNLQKGRQSVDVSALSPGVYLVHLQTSGTERTVRLIKN
jgi:hypothetical protein